jgi:hypothetical protein
VSCRCPAQLSHRAGINFGADIYPTTTTSQHPEQLLDPLQVQAESRLADQRTQEYERNIEALIENIHQLRKQCEEQSFESAQQIVMIQQLEQECSALKRMLKQQGSAAAVHKVSGVLHPLCLAETSFPLQRHPLLCNALSAG